MIAPSRKFVRSWLKGLAAALAVGVFLTLAGAFGSGGMPFWERLAYWSAMMLIGAVIGGAIAHVITESETLDDRPIVRGVVMSIAIAMPITILVWAATVIFTGRAWRLEDIAGFIGPVYVISAVMTVIGHLLDRPVETHAAPPEAAPARFLDRLPFKLKGAAIRAVEAEDHYLRIHTDRGSDLILMRLADAVVELEGVEGAQVHRSWWVARDAVTDVRRGDGRAVLTLKGGIEAPVSRRYAPGLRKSGWY